MKNNRTRILKQQPMRYRLAMVLLVMLLAPGCLGVQATPAPTPAAANDPTGKTGALPEYWPSAGWRASTPEEQVMDSQKLTQMLEYVEQRRLKLHSLLIIRNGYLVSETYFQNYQPDQKHELYSCTKSFIATLVGIAIEQGAISGVDQKVLQFFPGKTFENPDERKAAMTLEDLLTMTSGLDWEEGDLAYARLYRSNDWVEHMLDLPLRTPPGERFNYCTGCSHLLSAIIQQQAGMSTQDFAEKTLFEPLGIEDYNWSLDATGIAIGGWGLQLTPRDMAKLGYLYLHDGNWDGAQIVPAAWVKEATRKHVDTEDEGFGYGYQWWIYPSVAAYSALGMGGQTIFVAPSLNLVVATTAEVSGHEDIYPLIENYILPAVNGASAASK
ncbi:MAG: serine hydrolase [Anaerolineales bacterium]|nr:serine hydrolase [Anaerolineales bacterium]